MLRNSLEKRVLEKLIPVDSIVFFISQHRLKKMNEFRRTFDPCILIERKTLLQELIFIERLDMLESKFSEEHPIESLS